MLLCEQTPGQSVYQHGVSVNQYFTELMDYLKNSNLLDENRWMLPSWIGIYKNDLLSNLHEPDKIDQYLRFHDAGKPYCRTVDESGKVHFPNHAEVSKNIWLSIGGDQTVANLIGDDMICHIATAEEIKEHCKIWTAKVACTLFLASISELHSNANLFGGLDSISYKIKFKQLDKRGKQICKHYFGDKNDKR